MIAIDERVAFVEGRMAEQSLMFADLREAIASLERRLDARLDRLDGRFNDLQSELSKNFRWVVGIQVTTLITVVAALFGAVALR